MICPQCGYENIQGADECEGCKQDLTHLDDPTAAADSPVERLLMEDPVRRLKPAQPISVDPQATVREVVQQMIENKIGCVLVAEGGEVLGIFTERDLLMKIGGCERELENSSVREWMTPNPATIEVDDSIGFAIHRMDIGGYRHLPVMHAGQPRGIISVRDVVRFLAAHLSPS